MMIAKVIRFVFVFLVIAGCAGKPDVTEPAVSPMERMTARITQFERNQAVMKKRLDELMGENGRLREENEMFRNALGAEKLREIAKTKGLDESRGFEFQVTRVAFVFLTTPMDWDGASGDDGISVYVSPFDQDGDAIKRAGSFVFELYGSDGQSGKSLMRWSFTEDEAAKHWVFFPSCYHFRLKWRGKKSPPEKAFLRAVFTSALGGTFSTGKDLDIILAQ
jgi:hypothetical protein